MKAVLQSEFPYNISARCINRDWFSLDMQRVWEIFCEELTRTHGDYNLMIHSFVLMSNHFHMIASTPDANISECMHQFMGRSSRRLTAEGNRINETFAGRHFKCILHHPNHFLNAYKYNYRNPVAAGACLNVEDYPFSSLKLLLSNSTSEIPLVEDWILQSGKKSTLEWLNTPPDPKKAEAFKIGLKNQYFKSLKSRIDNKPLLADDELL